VWALNEKRMIQWADLTNRYGRFSSLGSSEEDLNVAIHDVRVSIGEIEAEVLIDPDPALRGDTPAMQNRPRRA
jgi:hypothetical protein